MFSCGLLRLGFSILQSTSHAESIRTVGLSATMFSIMFTAIKKNKTHLKKSCKSVQVLLFQSISLPRSNQTLLLNVTIIAESQLCLYREKVLTEKVRDIGGDMDVFAEETNSGSLFTCKRTALNWNSVAWLKCFVTHRKRKKKSQSVFRNIEAKENAHKHAALRQLPQEGSWYKHKSVEIHIGFSKCFYSPLGE